MKADLISKPELASRGAGRYVVGKIERFDQKNDIFKRARWDPSQLKKGQKYYVERWDAAKLLARNKVGYTLLDAAFEDAAWRLELEFAEGNRGGNQGLYAWETKKGRWMRLPPEMKLSVDDRPKMTRDMKRVATFFGASLVGVSELDRRWLYSHAYLVYDGVVEPVKKIEIPEEYKYAITIVTEMDYETIKLPPNRVSAAATGLGYSKMAITAGLLAKFIQDLGYKAIPTGNDTACNIPIAIDAGLGELSRSGLLITPELGPRLRLSKVLTDLPLVPDEPIEFGVWDFCRKCQKCAENCPSQAIMSGEPTEEVHSISNRKGLLRWPIDAEKCLGFWAANGAGCSNCIRVCPFNKPSGWLHRTVRWGIKNTRWLDSTFIKLDDLFGYGEEADPAHFWE